MSDEQKQKTKDEIEAMATMAAALLPLEKDAQWRALKWLVDKALGSRIAPINPLSK